MSTRISTVQMFQGGQAHVGSAKEREVASTDRSASLKELRRPSDNPGGWVEAANLKNEVTMKESMVKNAMAANHILTATEGVLSQLQEYSQRAHELAISGSSTSYPKQGEFLVSEVQGLYENVIRALNTKYGGRTLLAGLKGNGLAFGSDGKFVGDHHSFHLEVDKDLEVPASISSVQAVLGEGLKEGVDLPATFIRLLEGLTGNDVDRVRGTLDEFARVVDQISLVRSQIGARMNQINQVQEAHANAKIRNSEVISKIEEADPVKAFSDLARDQTVLRAAISTTEKVLKDNPVEILFK